MQEQLTELSGNDLEALASALVDRVELATRAGLTYGGDRDVFAELGYKRTLSVSDYRERYERDSLARRIVNLPATATWRRDPVVSDGDASSPFSTTWAKLVRRLNVFHYLCRVDRVSGLGRYGIMLIGVSGDSDGSKPLGKIDADRIAYLSVYAEDNAPNPALVADRSNPRFNLPEFYQLQSDRSPTMRVHYTRVIHVAEGLMEDEVYGEPRLRSVWNRLDDLEKLVGSAAEASWRLVDRGVVWEMDPKARLSDKEKSEMVTQLDKFAHRMIRHIRLRGVTPKVLGSESPTPTATFRAIMALISGTKGIPQRLLLGSERGELASSQDRGNWADVIAERRLQHAEPQILRPFVDRLIGAGALPEPAGGEYSVAWEPALTMTPLEQAETAQRTASAIRQIAQQDPQNPQPVISGDEFRSRWLEK